MATSSTALLTVKRVHVTATMAASHRWLCSVSSGPLAASKRATSLRTASRNPGAVVELDLGGSKDFVCETLVRCCTHIDTLRAVVLSVVVVGVVMMFVVMLMVVVARKRWYWLLHENHMVSRVVQGHAALGFVLCGTTTHAQADTLSHPNTHMGGHTLIVGLRLANRKTRESFKFLFVC